MSSGSSGNLSEPPIAAAADAAPLPVAGPHAELLARIWQQTLPLMRERVETLVQTAQLASTEGLSPSARINAVDLAHKLAGSLGMFGFPRGTEIAREMENFLEATDTPDPAQLADLVRNLKAALPL